MEAYCWITRFSSFSVLVFACVFVVVKQFLSIIANLASCRSNPQSSLYKSEIFLFDRYQELVPQDGFRRI